MKKLMGVGVVLMLATAASGHAVGGEQWTCHTPCLDAWGYEYLQVAYGEGPDQAYQNLSCREGDTVAGEINCWEDTDIPD